MFEEQWIQSFQHILIIHGGLDRDGEGFTGIFIKHGEHFIRHPIAEPVVNEIHTPYMILVLRAQANDRCVLMVEAFPFLVPLWQLQPFFPPQSLNFLVIDLPALDPKKGSNLAIAIAAILLGEPDQCQAKAVVILLSSCFVTLCGSWSTKSSTGAALRSADLLT